MNDHVSNTTIRSFLEAMDDAVSSADDSEAPPVADTADAATRRFVRRLAQRMGMIGPFRCFIEETDLGSFVLHGLPEGDWDLIAEEPEWDEQLGEYPRLTTGAAMYVARQLEQHDLDCEPRHVMVGLSSGREADAFFTTAGRRWHAEEVGEGDRRARECGC